MRVHLGKDGGGTRVKSGKGIWMRGVSGNEAERERVEWDGA